MIMHHHTPTSNVKDETAGTRNASSAATCDPVRRRTMRHNNARMATCMASDQTISAVHEPGHPACRIHWASSPHGCTCP